MREIAPYFFLSYLLCKTKDVILQIMTIKKAICFNTAEDIATPITNNKKAVQRTTIFTILKIIIVTS